MNKTKRWRDPIEIAIVYQDDIENYLHLCKPEDRSLALAVARCKV